MRELILDNLIFIIIVIFFITSFIRGYEKGFIRKVVSIATIVVTIIVTKTFTPTVVEVLKDMTNIEATVNDRIYEALIKTNIFDNLNLGVLQGFFGTGDMQNIVRDKIAAELTTVALNFICGICLFIFTFLIIKIIIRLLDFIDYIPVIGEINKLLGGVSGIIEALIIIWLVFSIIKIFENVPAVKNVIDNIDGNPIVNMLYDNNMIYNFFASLFKPKI